MKQCLLCKKKIGGHPNRKRCEPCARELRRKPATTMTPTQIAMAKAMIGKMSRENIARAVGTSVPSLKRAFRGTRLAYYNWCSANPGLVRQVCKYFETHNQDETAKHFGLKRKQVDHAVYRYKKFRSPKQIRWTSEQIAEAVKMAGLVSLRAQARYFNRPNANTGSVKSLWAKRLSSRAASVNGMAHWQAKHLVTSKARYLQSKSRSQRTILWVDLEKCLKSDTPDFIGDAVSTMANFQRWIWRDQNPKRKILKMIKEREICPRK